MTRLIVFYLLAYLLSWWFAPFTGGQLLPHGPALAAVIVVAATAGRRGLAEFWRGLTRWRVAWQWYLIGPAIIAGYHSLGIAAALLLGARLAGTPALLSAGVWLELLLAGGQWEEPGWTGYALPALLDRFGGRRNGFWIAVLAAGFARAVWHLPLFLYGHIPWFDVFVFSFAFQALIAWLYVRSGGSVPVVFVFHFASNVLGSVFRPVFDGPDRVVYQAAFMGLACLAALAVLRFARPAARPTALPAG